jgi:uncharacterized protein (DUF1810 family)
MAEDAFDLERFVEAQGPVMEQVRSELRRGQKRGHWMWFVFPQIKGLGRSETAVFYAIESREEAVAYLKHPVLGPRLVECTRLVLGVTGRANVRTSEQIFGEIDSMKFRSSMTLFAQVTVSETAFQEALDKYFDGEADPATLEVLE